MICLSETRIKDKPLTDISITGYSVIHEICNNLLEELRFIFQKHIILNCQKINLLCFFFFDSVWLTNYANNCTVNVGLIYRHPSFSIRPAAQKVYLPQRRRKV